MSRIAIVAVEVVDWHEVGPAFEVDTEEGPVVRAPYSQPALLALAANGERFVFGHEFANDEAGWQLAGRVADQVRAAGSIDPELWSYHYPMYGSDAWQEENDMAMDYVRAGRSHELAGHVLGGLV